MIFIHNQSKKIICVLLLFLISAYTIFLHPREIFHILTQRPFKMLMMCDVTHRCIMGYQTTISAFQGPGNNQKCAYILRRQYGCKRNGRTCICCRTFAQEKDSKGRRIVPKFPLACPCYCCAFADDLRPDRIEYFCSLQARVEYFVKWKGWSHK